MRRVLPLVLQALTACTFTKLGFDDVASDAQPAPDVDPNAPDADLTIPDAMTFDVPPGTPDACVAECVSSTMIRDCPSGMTRLCTLGCDETGGAHCQVMIPSNDPNAVAHLSGATADLVVPYTFDTSTFAWSIFTDTGEIRDEMGFQVRSPGTGVHDNIGYYQDGNLGIFTMDTLTIDDNAQLWGFGVRALVFITSGNVTIHGKIDVSAGYCADGATVNRACPGPGGGFGAGGAVSPDPADHATGCAPGGNGNDGAGDKTGGGGGGLGIGAVGVGGSGADGDPPPVGGAGGDPGAPGSTCPDETLIPLAGGSGGGWGGGTTGGRGGGGGGAVQISSYTGITFSRIGISSEVGVWTGGGGGGLGNDDEGGGGGGAGGAVLLEAPVVTIDAFSYFAANGGGGGGGNAGASGDLGVWGLTTTPGGAGGSQGGFSADGGNGGALFTAAEDGAATGDKKGTGGGGGAVGIFRINADVTTGGTTTSSPLVSVGPLSVM